MSAHFAVLREADLIDGDKEGTTITYRLKLSVLEDALLGFADTFQFDASREGERRGAFEPLEGGA